MYKYLLSLMCVLSLSAEMVDGVAIVVKEKAITLYDIKKVMRESNVDAKVAANTLIRQKLEEAEIKDRKISVSSSEVYEDIKDKAQKNNMSVSQFYEAILNSSGLNSEELKEKVKQTLLSQKLYASIAYSQISEPTEDEIQEYFNLNKAAFTHPSAFTVVIYQSNDKLLLVEKMQNPMFNSADVQAVEQTLEYNRISPELARLLENTPINGFSPIVPNAQGGFMSFYIKEIKNAQEMGIESVKYQIINTITSQKREQVLSDYFARLRDNAQINIIRMPK